MGHQCISVRTNGNSNTHANRDGNSYSDGHANPNSDIHAHVDFYACTKPNPNSDTHSYSFSHGYPDALSSNRSELCRRENSERADHLAERRIHHQRNHEWAARAQNQLAELAAWLPRRLLDNDDIRQRSTVAAAVSAATGSVLASTYGGLVFYAASTAPPQQFHRFVLA